MRKLLLLSLFLLLSVNPSHSQTSGVDYNKSFIQLFPDESKGEESWYYFYVALKDSRGKFVDILETDFELKTSSNKSIDFHLDKLFTGRYNVKIKHDKKLQLETLNFFVQGKLLKEKFKLFYKRPFPAHSKLTLVAKQDSSLKIRLQLLDKHKAPVDPPEIPEILLDGAGEIVSMERLGPGQWEFSVIYPEQNQIMYFSVRSMGVYLPNLFRYQHVEK